MLIGPVPCLAVSFWVRDMKKVSRPALTVGAVLGFDLTCRRVFGGVLDPTAYRTT